MDFTRSGTKSTSSRGADEMSGLVQLRKRAETEVNADEINLKVLESGIKDLEHLLKTM